MAERFGVQKQRDTFEKIGLPALAVLETVLTKGRSPGTTAMGQQQNLATLRQQAAEREEREREAALQRRLQEGVMGLEDLTPAESVAIQGGMGADVLKGRLKPRGKTMEETVQEQLALRSAIESMLGEQRLQTEAGKRALDRPLPSGQAKEFAQKRASLNMLDNMMGKASKLNLWFMPGDQLRALNPWDTEAKAFQQLVATTKQVIGKGLEGGVLRKEDENKYEKIIPRLGDTWDVLVKKANQLKEMLTTDYNENVRSFGDAGFKVEKFPTIDFTPFRLQLETTQSPQVKVFPDDAALDKAMPGLSAGTRYKVQSTGETGTIQ